jgi:4-hydroxybenzoate polyprenyltransferase
MTNAALTTPPAPALSTKLCAFARDIKFSHSIFAMPWALLSTVLAGHTSSPGLTVLKLALIVVCMVSARTVAMAANRLMDASIDAGNPRTARRAIPSGALSRGFVLMALLVCAAAFIAACSGFSFAYRNPWPMALSLPVLAFVSAYPLLKRFTRLCHYYLGASLALAPVCAWVAVRGDIAAAPLLMAAAVLLWTAGFDIIYACQDYTVDVAAGLFSVPAKIGIPAALWVSRITHAVCVAVLVVLGMTVHQFGALYFIGVAIAVGLLVIEHLLVKPNDLSKVGVAFFTVNGIISVIIGTLGIVDIYR